MKKINALLTVFCLLLASCWSVLIFADESAADTEIGDSDHGFGEYTIKNGIATLTKINSVNSANKFIVPLYIEGNTAIYSGNGIEGAAPVEVVGNGTEAVGDGDNWVVVITSNVRTMNTKAFYQTAVKLEYDGAHDITFEKWSTRPSPNGDFIFIFPDGSIIKEQAFNGHSTSTSTNNRLYVGQNCCFESTKTNYFPYVGASSFKADIFSETPISKLLPSERADLCTKDNSSVNVWEHVDHTSVELSEKQKNWYFSGYYTVEDEKLVEVQKILNAGDVKLYAKVADDAIPIIDWEIRHRKK